MGKEEQADKKGSLHMCKYTGVLITKSLQEKSLSNFLSASLVQPN